MFFLFMLWSLFSAKTQPGMGCLSYKRMHCTIVPPRTARFREQLAQICSVHFFVGVSGQERPFYRLLACLNCTIVPPRSARFREQPMHIYSRKASEIRAMARLAFDLFVFTTALSLLHGTLSESRRGLLKIVCRRLSHSQHGATLNLVHRRYSSCDASISA